MEDTIYNSGIYVRLSREDESGTQSESIQNQKDFLIDIVKKQRWNLVDIYCDDGYTGTNFDRPEFKRMINDIKLKRINLVLTKDLSRLGRDYIDTGYYLERFFPEQGVRYIAVNDKIDTLTDQMGGSDITPFKSVLNDLYARDISRKVRTVMDTKRKKGDFIGAFGPFGYRKDPENKNRLVIDEKAAHIVRRIFQMYLEGNGFTRIARILNSEGVPSPSIYKSQYSRYKCPTAKQGLWTHSTVRNILLNPTYAGHITQRKHLKINYKLKRVRSLPPSDWITVRDTHPSIIDEQSFVIVQKMISNKAGGTAGGIKRTKAPRLLSGLLYCGDCGEKMTYTKTSGGLSCCICSKYKRFGLCSRHSILESYVETCILQDLRRISRLALDQDFILKAARHFMAGRKGKEDAREIERIKLRLADIQSNLKNMYEDRTKGVLTKQDFMDLLESYAKEREELGMRLDYLLKREKKYGSNFGSDNPTKRIMNIISFEAIEPAFINRLIKRIEIFEKGRITIYYDFRNPFSDGCGLNER